MGMPMKVLVIEDRNSDRLMAQLLLENYTFEFTWEQAVGAAELRAITQQFKPTLMFSADQLAANSRACALDMLALMALQNAVIHVVEVDCAGRPTADVPFAILDDAESTSRLAPAKRHASGEAAPVTSLPTSHWWASLPTLLETSSDVVAISDAAGWITYANTEASRLLGEINGHSIGTVLGLAYDFASLGRGSHRLASFDSMTRLPSPQHISDLVECVMARAPRDTAALPVVALDLQGLRLMNESCGPDLSDEMLRVIGAELAGGDAPRGMIARVGEDDMLIVLPQPSMPGEGAVSLLRNRPAAEPPIELQDVPWPRLDTPAVPEDTRLPIEAGLDEALQREAIGVHYQPQFDLQSGRGCGVEALARWILTSGETIAPAVFIPAAERSGRIDAVSASVLRSACAMAAAWRGREAERLTISVNISTRQMNNEFSEILEQILESTGLHTQRLELEIAETAISGNADLVERCLRRWKRLGVRIAVNHVGGNYSGLGYLSQLPIDRLKLHKSLIHGMTAHSSTAGEVHALIALGAKLGVDVIAEGVETETQLCALMDVGCLQAQGYLFGRPMPAVQAQVVLRKPWGSLPKSMLRSQPAMHATYAS